MKNVVLAVIILALLGGVIEARRPDRSAAALPDAALLRIAASAALVSAGPAPSATLVITPPSRQRDLIEITPVRDFGLIKITPRLDGVAFRGYRLSCTNDLSIATRDPVVGWKTLYFPPVDGAVVIDGRHSVLEPCARVECTPAEVEYPQLITDTAYEYLGRRGEHIASAGATLPAYRSVYLRGMVRIEGAYYLDDGCRQRQRFSLTYQLPFRLGDRHPANQP
jgi:hypothetical protein